MYILPDVLLQSNEIKIITHIFISYVLYLSEAYLSRTDCTALPPALVIKHVHCNIKINDY